MSTDEGLIHIVTKTRWLMIFPLPHTSVMPHNGAALKSLGTFIKWNTNDGVVLSYLHEAIIRLVKQVGLSGLVEFKNSVQMTGRVAQTFGGSWQDIVKQAIHDGVAFPVPDDVLKHIKGFM